jgi:hypothetical protein
MGKTIEITKEQLNNAGTQVWMKTVRTLPLELQASTIFDEYKVVLANQMADENLATMEQDEFEKRLQLFLTTLGIKRDELELLTTALGIKRDDTELIALIEDIKATFLTSLENS